MKWQIPYAGETYVFDDARLTASEARLQKRLTGGLAPVDAEKARTEQLDPEAWVAALAIARRRIGLDADDAIEIDADELDLMAIADATKAAHAADLEAETARVVKASKAKKADEPAEPEPAATP